MKPSLWSNIVSHIQDHFPATHKDIRQLMAILDDLKATVDAVAISVNADSAKITDLKAQVAALQAQIAAGNAGAATEADLQAVVTSLNSIKAVADTAAA